MKETNYWQQFLNTGNVEDYLSYKSHEREDREQKKGEHSDAGTFQCDRHNIESGTFRGI